MRQQHFVKLLSTQNKNQLLTGSSAVGGIYRPQFTDHKRQPDSVIRHRAASSSSACAAGWLREHLIIHSFIHSCAAVDDFRRHKQCSSCLSLLSRGNVTGPVGMSVPLLSVWHTVNVEEELCQNQPNEIYLRLSQCDIGAGAGFGITGAGCRNVWICQCCWESTK